jgi:hypothetical protein
MKPIARPLLATLPLWMLLTACGGGGSPALTADQTTTAQAGGPATTQLYGTGTATTTSPTGVLWEMTVPDSARTGLSFTRPKALTDDVATFREVVAKLQVAFEAGPAVAATQSMGKAAQPYGTSVCTSGASGQYANGALYLSRCVVDGFELTAVSLSAAGTIGGGYQITTTSLAVGSGPGIPAITELRNVTADCERVDGQSKCKVTYKGSDNIDYQFGWDSAVSIVDRNVALNGTHDCGCEGTWQITYANFTGLAGRALVLGQGAQKAEFVRRDRDVYDIIWTDGAVTRRYRLDQGVLSAAV